MGPSPHFHRRVLLLAHFQAELVQLCQRPSPCHPSHFCVEGWQRRRRCVAQERRGRRPRRGRPIPPPPRAAAPPATRSRRRWWTSSSRSLRCTASWGAPVCLEARPPLYAGWRTGFFLRVRTPLWWVLWAGRGVGHFRARRLQQPALAPDVKCGASNRGSSSYG